MRKQKPLLVIEKHIGAKIISQDELIIIEVNGGCLNRVKLLGPSTDEVISGISIQERENAIS